MEKMDINPGETMSQPHVFEGTLEEIAEQLRLTDLSGRFKVFVMPEETETDLPTGEETTLKTSPHSDARQRPSILGKYAGRIPSVEAFLQEKQREIVREDSRFNS